MYKGIGVLVNIKTLSRNFCCHFYCLWWLRLWTGFLLGCRAERNPALSQPQSALVSIHSAHPIICSTSTGDKRQRNRRGSARSLPHSPYSPCTPYHIMRKSASRGEILQKLMNQISVHCSFLILRPIISDIILRNNVNKNHCPRNESWLTSSAGFSGSSKWISAVDKLSFSWWN